ncbi:hypothetical protein FQN54_002922 [Arachnomyces sp. PD_36]|nr:hypothetical protein FQN54_002922 [Arachnomyces sp. PD_36]
MGVNIVDHSETYREPEWIKEPTEEPLSTKLKFEVRQELKRIYARDRESNFRTRTWRIWCSPGPQLRDPEIPPEITTFEFKRLANKPTTLYWLAHAEYDGRAGVPSACIYKQWFHCHNLDPYLDFEHYFSTVIRVPPSGPTTVSSLLRMHASICEQAASVHARLRSGELAKFSESNILVSPDPDNYQLMPLCRSIIVVLDKPAEDEGFTSVKEEIHRRTILLIITDDTSGLSAPISFDSIESDCLPLESDELKVDCDAKMARVTIGTGVKFIADLMKREQVVDRSRVEKSLCPVDDNDKAILSADDFADIRLRSTREKGIDGDPDTYEAVRRVKASMRGDVWPEPEADPWLGRTWDPPFMGPWD